MYLSDDIIAVCGMRWIKGYLFEAVMVDEDKNSMLHATSSWAINRLLRERDLLMGIRLNVCNDIDIDDLDVKSQSVLTSHVLDLYRFSQYL